MSEEEKDLEKKVEDLQEELKWLEAKFHRSGIDPAVRMKTLLRMQKRTQEFVIWLARAEGRKKLRKGRRKLGK